MHDALPVREVQRLGQRLHVFDDLFGIHRIAADSILEVSSGHERRDDVRVALVLTEVVYLQDVGVIEASGGLRLLGEPLNEGGVLRVVRRQDFDSDETVKLGIVAPEDRRHAATA